MSVEPLTRAELDTLRCATPGCTHADHPGGLVLNSRCHPRRPVLARYWNDGTVEIRCNIDNKWIMSFAVTAADRDRLNADGYCKDPECTLPPEQHSMRLRSACHPTAGLIASYDNGHMVITCARCKARVEGIAIKDKPTFAEQVAANFEPK